MVPEVDLDAGPTFVEENTTITLPKCHVTGSPTPEVKWSKVGGSLTAQIAVEDGQLKIVNATKQDAGLYKCEATNSVGSDEAETSVEVIEFVKPPEVLNTTKGAGERVKCRVTTKSELQVDEVEERNASPHRRNSEADKHSRGRCWKIRVQCLSRKIDLRGWNAAENFA